MAVMPGVVAVPVVLMDVVTCCVVSDGMTVHVVLMLVLVMVFVCAVGAGVPVEAGVDAAVVVVKLTQVRRVAM